MVLDNLNTDACASLYEAFEPTEARQRDVIRRIIEHCGLRQDSRARALPRES